jgi:hypothetical protein
MADSAAGYDDVSHEYEMEHASGEGFIEVDNSRKRKSRGGSLGSEGDETRDSKARRVLASDSVAVIIKCTSINLAKTNPLLVKAMIDVCVEEQVKILKLADGGLKVLCESRADAMNLVKSCVFSDAKRTTHKVFATLLEKTVFCKGIIFGVDVDITDEDLKTNVLSPYEEVVASVLRIKNRSGEALPHVILSFEGKDLPEYVMIGYSRFNVKPYVPRPIRCFRCQQYGHMANACRGGMKCPVCAEDHSYADCHNKGSPKCAQCGEKHSVSFKGCSKYVQAVAVSKVRSVEKLSYSQALKRVNAVDTAPVVGVSDGVLAGSSTSPSSSSINKPVQLVSVPVASVPPMAVPDVLKMVMDSSELWHEISTVIIKAALMMVLPEGLKSKSNSDKIRIFCKELNSVLKVHINDKVIGRRICSSADGKAALTVSSSYDTS